MENRDVFRVDPDDIISDLREENELLRLERAELRRSVEEHLRDRDQFQKTHDDATYQHMIDLSRKDEVIRVAHTNMSRIESQFASDRQKLQVRIKELINTEHMLRIECDRAKKAYKSHLLELKCIISDLRDEIAVQSQTKPGAGSHSVSKVSDHVTCERAIQTDDDNSADLPWEEQPPVMDCQQFNAALRTHLIAKADLHDPACAYYEAGPVLNVQFPYYGGVGDSNDHFNAFELTSCGTIPSKKRIQSASTLATTTSSSLDPMSPHVDDDSDATTSASVPSQLIAQARKNITDRQDCSAVNGSCTGAGVTDANCHSDPVRNSTGPTSTAGDTDTDRRSDPDRNSTGPTSAAGDTGANCRSDPDHNSTGRTSSATSMLLNAVIGEKNFWRRKASSLQKELWKHCPGRRVDKLSSRISELLTENSELKAKLEVLRRELEDCTTQLTTRQQCDHNTRCPCAPRQPATAVVKQGGKQNTRNGHKAIVAVAENPSSCGVKLFFRALFAR